MDDNLSVNEILNGRLAACKAGWWMADGGWPMADDGCYSRILAGRTVIKSKDTLLYYGRVKSLQMAYLQLSEPGFRDVGMAGMIG